jgi:hypothetical protein
MHRRLGSLWLFSLLADGDEFRQPLPELASIEEIPVAGLGPILTAERIEDPALKTVLTYGHVLTN